MNLRSGRKTIRDGGEVREGEQGDDTTTPAQSKHKYDDGSVYEGGWSKGGVRHGQGKLTKASGYIFEGEWVDDKFVKGTRKSPDGEIYEGEFKDGLPHGKGTAKFASGGVYDGEWKECKRDGQGTYTFADGSVYDGEWECDKEHGKGTKKWHDGHVYEGDYRDGQLHGTGVLKHANGWVYTGEYQNGVMHGRGTYTYANGRVYDGEFRDDKRHGYGTFTFANGRVYEGGWRNGKQHGFGTMKEGGIEFKQVYKDDELLSSKPVATLISGTLVDGPPSQRPRIDRDVDKMFLLTEEDTQCEICLEDFASDRNAEDESTRKRLPVLSKTCDHFFCHGCILKQQQSLANKKKNAPPPQWIKCMKCRKENAFCPGEPWYDRRLINMLNEFIPVRGLWSTNAMERDATKAGSLADIQK